MRKELYDRLMQKRAGALEEVAASAAAGMVPFGIGPTATGIGTLHGMIAPAPSVEEEADLNADELKGMIPGVSASRIMRRLKRQLKNDAGSSPRAIATAVAPALHVLLGGLGGGIIGGFIGSSLKAEPLINYKDKKLQADHLEGVRNDNIRTGAALGGLAGVGAVSGIRLISSLLAAITDTRTKEEQREAANAGVGLDYLVPGVSTYNYWKSIGRSMADQAGETSPSNRIQKVRLYS